MCRNGHGRKFVVYRTSKSQKPKNISMDRKTWTLLISGEVVLCYTFWECLWSLISTCHLFCVQRCDRLSECGKVKEEELSECTWQWNRCHTFTVNFTTSTPFSFKYSVASLFHHKITGYTHCQLHTVHTPDLFEFLLIACLIKPSISI